MIVAHNGPGVGREHIVFARQQLGNRGFIQWHNPDPKRQGETNPSN